MPTAVAAAAYRLLLLIAALIPALVIRLLCPRVCTPLSCPPSSPVFLFILFMFFLHLLCSDDNILFIFYDGKSRRGLQLLT